MVLQITFVRKHELRRYRYQYETVFRQLRLRCLLKLNRLDERCVEEDG